MRRQSQKNKITHLKAAFQYPQGLAPTACDVNGYGFIANLPQRGRQRWQGTGGGSCSVPESPRLAPARGECTSTNPSPTRGVLLHRPVLSPGPHDAQSPPQLPPGSGALRVQSSPPSLRQRMMDEDSPVPGYCFPHKPIPFCHRNSQESSAGGCCRGL